MKGLNFLQVYSLKPSEADEYNLWLGNLLGLKYPCVAHWAVFLNKPFNPEMIEKYFAIIQGKHFEFTTNLFKIFTEYEECIERNIYPRPRTLDEFITNCQQAEIELRLK